MKTRNYVEFLLIAGLIALCLVVFICANQRDKYKYQLKQATVQNVQLTKEMRQTKADAYKDGLIACGNEDVDYLNQLADDYGNSELGKLFRDMAMGWAYDEETLNDMIDDYMDDERSY